MSLHSPYREYPPGTDLAPYVDCLWTWGQEGRHGRYHRVLPDGCVDFLFRFRSLGCAPEARLVGTMTRALLVPMPMTVGIAAVRFRPGGAYPGLMRPLSEFTDHDLPLQELWPEVDRLVEALAQVRTLAQAVDLIRDRLRHAWSRRPAPDARVEAAAKLLAARPDVASVTSLSRELGLTRQHLNRLFQRHVGVGPKRLARVMRLQYAIAEARRGRRPDWAALAQRAGYFDQSHLSGEFRELIGLSPSRYLAARDA